ncbi:MAG: thiamine-phosphate kinase [bacterium]
MHEFELIARFFAPLADDQAHAFGLRDDAALVPLRPGHEVVATVDAIVEGVHFLTDDPADLVARKLLRVNLSDLAAKGAEPANYLLAAAFRKEMNTEYVSAFARGLAHDQKSFGVSLLGGDTVATPGPATFSLTAFGHVPEGAMIRRAGARPGDALYVTGTIGDSFLGLGTLRGKVAFDDENQREWVISRYRLPQPRCTLGVAARGLASACLDVSDGLIADAGHLAEESGVACVIEAGAVPLSAPARAALERGSVTLTGLLSGGDDYELLFTVPPEMASHFEMIAGRTGTAATRIGRTEAGQGIRVLNDEGRTMNLEHSGYEHFR